ncbi:MAG: hypothetical protein F9K44_15225 [Hyphomicrobiaceae bacterium]|nr:MAG: hypothetical protein F9K44_15225 [Hyphomicrobiaceae bacterium]
MADDSVRRALETVRRANNELSWPEARVAREAVFDGAFFEALRGAIAAGGPEAEQASAVLRALNDLLPELDLPAEIETAVAARMKETLQRVEGGERRRRQLALLATPDPYGEAALTVADELDELERPPG